MTKEESMLLLKQAGVLTSLGITVEHERNNLRELVERGVPYDSPEMLNTLENFLRADTEWKRLEAKHLQLRERLGIFTKEE